VDTEFGKNSWKYIYTETFSKSRVFIRSSPRWLTFEEGLVYYWRLEDYSIPQYQYILRGHHDDYDFTFMLEIGFYKYSFQTKKHSCLKQQRHAETMGCGNIQSETKDAYILSSVVVTENENVIVYLINKR
tara:strand:- start:36930 stop:37319 length:390 start_codon:yes stop_codon:yes gene_type:complete